MIAFAHVGASFHKRLQRGDTIWLFAVIAEPKWLVRRSVRNAGKLKADRRRQGRHKQEDR